MLHLNGVYGSVMGLDFGQLELCKYLFLPRSARAFSAGGCVVLVVEYVKRCIKALSAGYGNDLRQYPFVGEKLGFGNYVSGGLCVIRANHEGSLKHLSYVIHCCGNGTECKGVVGVEMLVVTVCAMLCAEMEKTVTAVYRHSDSWN